MKKIGILTFHYADNFGAVLQCYALRTFINSMPGMHAEIINYIPEGYQYPVCWNNSYQKYLFLQKRAYFDTFLKQYCGLNEAVCQKVTGEKYDICCVGSDQIWNVLGDYKEYFLPNVDDHVKKIAYAASIGCSPEFLYRKKNWLQNHISRFAALSVREKLHVASIEEISGMKCECVLDPTLIVDIETFNILQSDRKGEYMPYLFFYWLEHDDTLMRGIELANTIARKYGLRIKHSIYRETGKLLFQNEGCMYYERIEDFLWYVRNASFVVTNSYHGTIFSILYQKPFYVYAVYSMKSRTETLASTLKFENRVVRRYISWEEISDNVDYSKINKRIKEQSKKSIQFLNHALY